MSHAAFQAAAFYRDVARTRSTRRSITNGVSLRRLIRRTSGWRRGRYGRSGADSFDRALRAPLRLLHFQGG